MWRKDGSYVQLRRGAGSGGPPAPLRRSASRSSASGNPLHARDVVLPSPAFGPAASPEAVTVTSVTVFPQYPGPRPLVPPPGGPGAVRAPAAGHPVSPPTHDQGGGDLPLVGVRRTPAATTERTGIGRGARLQATLERAIAAQRMASGPGLIGYLLEAPWEEGVAASLPPPLLQVPPVSSAQDPGCPVAVNDPVPPRGSGGAPSVGFD